MHSSNRICTLGITTFTPSEVSRGVCSIQSTGQKLTQASQPVQLSGMTTAISFGFFFLSSDFGRGFRDDECWICFFRIVCHYRSLLSSCGLPTIVTCMRTVLISPVCNIERKIVEHTSRKNNRGQPLPA